jgi:hypothetical protein
MEKSGSVRTDEWERHTLWIEAGEPCLELFEGERGRGPCDIGD